MPFFQPAFYAPAQVDGNAFANIFQLINDIDGYQRQSACESACKPKQQPQQQRQTQSKPQPKPQPTQQKPQPAQKQPQEPKATFRHPFEEFFNSIQQSAAAAAEAQRAASLPTFHPRFDVRETQDSYELHGELAGVDRSNISLEFTEPQTLVVSGKSERNYHTQKPVPAVENTPDAIPDTHSEASHDDDDAASTHGRSGARTPVDDEEFTEIASQRSVSPARSHRATVTDEKDEEALERGETIVEEKKAVVPTPAPVTTAPAQTSTTPTEKYWYQERAIGHFKREFNFPVPVDEANVRASLENGILSVSVPKAKREVRRILVL